MTVFFHPFRSARLAAMKVDFATASFAPIPMSLHAYRHFAMCFPGSQWRLCGFMRLWEKRPPVATQTASTGRVPPWRSRQVTGARLRNCYSSRKQRQMCACRWLSDGRGGVLVWALVRDFLRLFSSGYLAAQHPV